MADEQPRDSKGQFAETDAVEADAAGNEKASKYDDSGDLDSENEVQDSTEDDAHASETAARIHGEKVLAHAAEASKAHKAAAKAAHKAGDHEKAKVHEKAASLLDKLGLKNLKEIHEQLAEHIEKFSETVKKGNELGKWAIERSLGAVE